MSALDNPMTAECGVHYGQPLIYFSHWWHEDVKYTKLIESIVILENLFDDIPAKMLVFQSDGSTLSCYWVIVLV